MKSQNWCPKSKKRRIQKKWFSKHAIPTGMAVRVVNESIQHIATIRSRKHISEATAKFVLTLMQVGKANMVFPCVSVSLPRINRVYEYPKLPEIVYRHEFVGTLGTPVSLCPAITKSFYTENIERCMLEDTPDVSKILTQMFADHHVWVNRELPRHVWASRIIPLVYCRNFKNKSIVDLVREGYENKVV